MMNYIIIDLEFNQPFDFPQGAKTELDPKCPFEIIQIGAVKMNNEFKIIDTGDFLIKPSIYKRIHPFVKKITGINSELLAKQEGFTDVFVNFLNFIGSEEYVFCVWGGNDIKALFNNIEFHKLDENTISPRYIDVQQLASAKLNLAQGMHIGLKNAIESFNIGIDGSFHYALNDAIYTAKIFELVYSPEMIVRVFTPQPMSLQPRNYSVNTDSLYKILEKEYGRKLTKKERKILLKTYLLGRSRQFDSVKTKKN